MAESENLYVARPSDVEALRAHLATAQGGNARFVFLQGPVGGGKRALVGEFLRSVKDFDGLIWRANLVDEEDGLRTMLRLYATLYSSLNRTPGLKAKVEAHLNTILPTKGKRVQGWYQAFIEGLRKGVEANKDGEGVQVTLPRENPLLGLVEILAGIASKVPVIADIQNVHACQSIALAQVFEGLMELGKTSPILLIASSEAIEDKTRPWMPPPLLDLIERRAADVVNLTIAPWGAEETNAYLASKGLSGNGAAIAAAAGGRPGFIAELVDILNEKGALNADSIDLHAMVPMTVDEDELDEGKPKEGRKYATAADIEDIAFRAALLGRAFPANLLADIGGYDRDSVDDLLDASGELFEELQFSEPMQTWIYQFKKANWREAVLDKARSRADYAEVARQTGTFLERFLVPRAYDFIIRTARLYTEAGEPARAAVMRSMALSSDRPEIWAMEQDLIKYFSQVAWPEAMRRTVYMNLMDRMVGTGDVNQAENLLQEILAWATQRDDKTLRAWLLFAGSRLDFRRNDYYRGRDRAKEALGLYRGFNDKLKVAEILNHLATIELSDGNPTAALQHVDEALREGMVTLPDGKNAVLPQVAANSEYIRGLVAKREKKFKEAGEHFRLSNEIAGNTGQAALALEAGLNFGETLLQGGDAARAADVLQRVVGIAQSLQNAVRQRAGMSLLAQAQASLKNFDAALRWSKATLDLTVKLGFKNFEAIDTYNVGLFTLMGDKPTEALALFRKARSLANLNQDAIFARELLFNMGMAAARSGEDREAREALNAMMPIARQTKDARKFVVGGDLLGALLAKAGDKANAKKVLEAALDTADKEGMKDEKRSIKKKLEDLG